MNISTFLSFIIFILLALSFTLCLVRCINCNRNRTINEISNNNSNRRNISISDNYLFGETKNNNIRQSLREAPPINHIPIANGEKVDTIHNGIPIILAEN